MLVPFEDGRPKVEEAKQEKPEIVDKVEEKAAAHAEPVNGVAPSDAPAPAEQPAKVEIQCNEADSSVTVTVSASSGSQ